MTAANIKTVKSCSIKNCKEQKSAIYIVREDFITKFNFHEFQMKIDAAMNNQHKPTFVMHEILPTNQKQAQVYDKNINFNKQSFAMLTKDLGEGAKRIQNEPNAGGTSFFSEILSCEILERVLNAKLTKTELEINYISEHSKKVDYLLTMNKSTFNTNDANDNDNNNTLKIGVSVTRAFKFIKNVGLEESSEFFTLEDAQYLLQKKLIGAFYACENVLNNNNNNNDNKQGVDHQGWDKTILHVLVPNEKIANTCKKAYRKLKCEMKRNVIVIVTVTKWMNCIYSERLYDHFL
ncbi:hypothetical protein ABK040_014981 [Willaertia magna]